MAGQIRAGVVGANIRVRVVEDGVAFPLQLASEKTLKLANASGDVIERTMSFEVDGSDGRLVYTTILGDIESSGPWQGQVFVTVPAGSFHTDPFAFNVAANLS